MSMTRVLGIGAWTMAALLCAACGPSVETGGTGTGTGTGGTTGTGGSPICPQEAFPCCPAGESGPCCAQCTTTGTGGTGGVGGSVFCGGIAGIACAADEYCDFSDDLCGGNDNGGVCTKRPLGCTDNFWPTCGCDGQVYGNPCDANSHGEDINDGASCAPPAGMFGCGAHFCTTGKEYCEMDGSDIGGTPSTFGCKPLPAGCGSAPDCACLSGVPCGTLCSVQPDGGLQIVCPGG
jgi:hypothetical protein